MSLITARDAKLLSENDHRATNLYLRIKEMLEIMLTTEITKCASSGKYYVEFIGVFDAISKVYMKVAVKNNIADEYTPEAIRKYAMELLIAVRFECEAFLRDGSVSLKVMW